MGKRARQESRQKRKEATDTENSETNIERYERLLAAASKVGNHAINCSNCVGACCRGRMRMEMTAAEARFFKAAGNTLTVVHPPVERTGYITVTTDTELGTKFIEGQLCKVVIEEAPQLILGGHGIYMLENDCVFLSSETEGPKCTAYDKRPGICRDFTMGGPGCENIRKNKYESGKFDGWQPIELTAKPE